MVTDTDTTNGKFSQITSARNSYHAPSAIQVALALGSNNIAIDYGTSSVNGMIINRNTKFTIKIANNNHYINDSKRTQNGTFSGTSDYSLYIFNGNGAGNLQTAFIGRIYSYKIFDGNTLVRNYIPCLRNIDNTIGLYDEANDVFYTNAGTGEFIKGNPIN